MFIDDGSCKYSKYKNYCKIIINCVTSRISKLANQNFVHFSTTKLCLLAGMMRGQKKSCWDGDRNKTCEDWVGMETKFAWMGWGMRDSIVGTGWGWERTAVHVKLSISYNSRLI